MQLTKQCEHPTGAKVSSGRRSTNRFPAMLTAGMLIAFSLLPVRADAANVTPVATKYSNAFSVARVPANLFNATGMNIDETILYNLDGSLAGETNTANGVSWVTSSGGDEAAAATAGRIWIVIDLGASFKLEYLDIWNFQWNTSGGLQNRGISQFDVLVRNTEADTHDGTSGGTPINVSNSTYNDSTDDDAIFNFGSATPWQEVLSNQSLAIAPNSDTYTATRFNMSGNTARFIAIRADSYYGGSGMGLGKIRISGTLDATLVSPVATKYSNAYSVTRIASNLFNATGMNIDETILYNLNGTLPGEPSSVDGVSWVTSSSGDEVAAATTGRVWIVIDLGASFNLKYLDIWNFQWDGYQNRGISQLDVLVRNTVADTHDGTSGGTPINVSNSTYNDSIDDDAIFNLGSSAPWQEVLSNQPLAIAPNSDTYTATRFDMRGNTARFIAIRADSHYSGAGMGLGKIRIWMTPPPAGTIVSFH